MSVSTYSVYAIGITKFIRLIYIESINSLELKQIYTEIMVLLLLVIDWLD